MGPAIRRQWLILSMLPRPPRWIATARIEAELRARGHDVHRRTIQRDLVQLSAIFPIVADERRKPFRWRWSEVTSSLGSVLVHAEMRGRKRLTTRLRVRNGESEHILEALDARDVHIDPDGRTVTCDVEDGPLSRRILMGFADGVEVLAPAALRRELGERLARAARLYTGTAW